MRSRFTQSRFSRSVRQWWARVFSRRQMRAELAQEMAGHLEAKTAALEAEGHSPEEAARRARIEFGNMPLMAERSVQQWQFQMAESVLADGKLALHKLLKAPGYAAGRDSDAGVGNWRDDHDFHHSERGDAALAARTAAIRARELRHQESHVAGAVNVYSCAAG